MRAWAVAVLMVAVGHAAAESVDRQKIEVDVDQGTSMAVAVSPDGRSIVMDLQGRLWVLASRGGDARPITDAAIEARLPAWSPRGELIAFQCFLEDNWNLCIVASDGSKLRIITRGNSDNREPSWHPDGARLIFASDGAGAKNFELWTVDLADQRLQRVSTTSADEGFPVWSPDGMQVAYIAMERDRMHLEVMPLARAGPASVRRVLSSGKQIALPAWTPDGSGLTYFEVDATTGETSHSIVDLNSGAIRRLTEADEDVFPSRVTRLRDGRYVYSADGVIKARRSASSQSVQLPFRARFSVERHRYGRRRSDLGSSTARAAKGIYRPRVSPDGRHVAFAAIGDLWLLRIGDPTPQQLTQDPFFDADPTWSTDGAKIAFTSDRRGTGTMDLWIRTLATNTDSRVTTTDESVSLPSWSPDGRKIAFYLSEVADWHGRVLHVLHVEQGTIERVHDSLFMPSRPSWSSDSGRLIVSTLRPISGRSRKGLNSILEINLQSRATRWLQSDPLSMRGSNGPEWAPNGTALAYVSDGQLWVISAAPSGELLAPSRRVTNELADSISWAGDSRSLVYQSADVLRKVSLDDGSAETVPLALTWKPAIPTGRTIVQAGRMLDVRTGAYRSDVDIVIDGNRITDIVPRRVTWPQATLVDARAGTVIPGLFESHIHQFSPNGERTGRLALAYGVTSLREVGVDPYEGLEAKEAWAAGTRIGPREFYSGLLEGQRVWYQMSLPTGSGALLDQELERARRLEYDFIKTYERLGDANLRRVVAWAHRQGIHVTSHDIYPAVAFGADAVEHLDTRDREVFSDRMSPRGRSYSDVLLLSGRSGLVTVPTAFWGRDVLMALEQGWSPMLLPQFARIVPDRYRAVALGLPQARTAQRIASIKRALRSRDEVIRGLISHGSPMLAGTDTSFYGTGMTLILEIKELTLGGLSPSDAIAAATIRAAEMLGVDHELGSLEPGKLADLVVIDGDPLANVLDLFRVAAVVKNGNVYPIERLLQGP
jgi:Tol biopolymer transport system component/imidazolonepropionase-like amidohydrolase